MGTGAGIRPGGPAQSVDRFAGLVYNLPRHPPAARRAPQRPEADAMEQPERTPRPATVLIVEDTPQHRELLEVYLEDLPEVETISAANGIEALEMVNRHKPELILLDIMMPKMSGFEICRHLKNNPETRDTLVIMITALNETGDIERATECGTDDYLTKPVDRTALVNLVRTMLQSRQSS